MKSGRKQRLLRWLKNLGKSLGMLLCAAVAATGFVAADCKVPADVRQDIASTSVSSAQIAKAEKATKAIPDYSRSEEQTYLTLPEWYIVYSSDELASYLRNGNPPSNFPYLTSVAQFWQNYCGVYGVTRQKYPFNTGYHVAMVVLGTSFALQYSAQEFYEYTVGRTFELLNGFDSEEDRYAAQTEQDYADFVHVDAFYNFPFGEKFLGLWQKTSLWGAHPVRKWERKMFLSAQYGFEAVYGWLIRVATHAAYAPEDLTIHLWVQNIPAALLKQDTRITLVAHVDSSSEIIRIPRYEPFHQILTELSQRGIAVHRIAGNSEILMTVIAERGWQYAGTDAQNLFSTDIATDATRQRTALRVPVENLLTVLPALQKDGVTVEHIYDY